jgi:hypothetical protein
VVAVLLVVGAFALFPYVREDVTGSTGSNAVLASVAMPRFEFQFTPGGFERDRTLEQENGFGGGPNGAPGVCRRFHYRDRVPICDSALGIQDTAYSKGDGEEFIDIATAVGPSDSLGFDQTFGGGVVPTDPADPQSAPDVETARVRGHAGNLLTAEGFLALSWDERDDVHVALTAASDKINKKDLLNLASELREISEIRALPLVVGTVQATNRDEALVPNYIAVGETNGHPCIVVFPLGEGCERVRRTGPVATVAPKAFVVGNYVYGSVAEDVGAVRIELDGEGPIEVRPFTTNLRRADRFFATSVGDESMPTRAIALDAHGRELGRASIDLFAKLRGAYVEVGRGREGGPWRMAAKRGKDGLCTQFDARDTSDEDDCAGAEPDPLDYVALSTYDGGYLVGETIPGVARVRVERGGVPYSETATFGAEKGLRAGFYVVHVGDDVVDPDTEDIRPDIDLVALDSTGNEMGRLLGGDQTGPFPGAPAPVAPPETLSEGSDAHGHWQVAAAPTADGLCYGVAYANAQPTTCFPFPDRVIVGDVNVDPDVLVAFAKPDVAKVRIELSSGKSREVEPRDMHPPFAAGRYVIAPVKQGERVKSLVALDAGGKVLGRFTVGTTFETDTSGAS